MICQVEQLVIHVASPDQDKRGTLIVLDMTDEEEARLVAKLLAEETGRCVTVRNSKLALVEVIPAASQH